MGENEVVRLIKGDTPIICDPDRAQYYLDKGFRIVGDEDEKPAEEVSVEGPRQDAENEEPLVEVLIRTELPGTINRQEAITIAVQHILDRNNSDELTGAGLPRIEIIAEEAGVDAVTAPERATAMESISK